MSTPEGAILRSIMDYLAARHVFAVRMNSGTQIGAHKGKKWAIHMNAPGTADILALVPVKIGDKSLPLPWFIEVKSEDGKQSDLQRSFECQVKGIGAQYFVARSIDDVEREMSRIQSTTLGD